MPRYDYANCRECGGHRDEVGLMSRSRLCETCYRRIVGENVDGLHFKTGQPMARWRRGMILSAGGLLPEQLQPRS